MLKVWRKCGISPLFVSKNLPICLKRQLDDMLENTDLKDRRIPFLFFANKMDIAGCLSPFECCVSSHAIRRCL